MVKLVKKENKELYQCEECSFHYENREWAEKCEVWCKEHHSRNIEITSHAVENKIVPQKTSTAPVIFLLNTTGLITLVAGNLLLSFRM